MTRRILTIACLVGLAGLLLFPWNGAGTAPPTTSPPHLPVESESPPEASRGDVQLPTKRRELPVERPHAPTTSEPNASTEIDRSRNVRRLRGTISVTDPAGDVFADESGSAHVVLWFGNGGTSAEVEVVDGRWEAEIRLGKRDPDAVATRVQFSACKLRGKPVLIEADALGLPRDGPLAFFGRWLPETRLRVLGDDTGLDLVDVTILGGMRFPYRDQRHPSRRATKVIVERGRSPLELQSPPQPQTHGKRRLWVTAPDYAWRPFRHDYGNGGDQVVRLLPGGGVDVWVLGNAAPKGAAVRMFAANGGGPYADFDPARGGATKIDHVEPGTYRIELQQGPWYRKPIVLARAEVAVVARERASVELHVAEQLAAPERVEVTGTLVVPDRWGETRRMYVTLQPDTEVAHWDDDWKTAYGSTFEPGAAEGEHEWKLGALIPGNYMLTVNPTEYREMVEVVAGRPNHLRVELAEPAEVLVRLRDTRGTALALPRIVWHGPIPGRVGGYGLESVTYDAERGGYPFLASPGPIFVSVRNADYESAESELAVHPGNNEFDVTVERSCGVRVTLLVDGVPFDGPSAGFALDPIDHNGRQVRPQAGQSHVSQPGRYRITFGAVEGYREIPAREVTIPPGEMVEIRVPMTRG